MVVQVDEEDALAVCTHEHRVLVAALERRGSLLGRATRALAIEPQDSVVRRALEREEGALERVCEVVEFFRLQLLDGLLLRIVERLAEARQRRCACRLCSPRSEVLHRQTRKRAYR